MFRKGEKGIPLLVVTDPQQRWNLLVQAHDKLGHQGVQATYETLQRRVYWPHLLADVKHHVQSCHQCQI